MTDPESIAAAIGPMILLAEAITKAIANPVFTTRRRSTSSTRSRITTSPALEDEQEWR